MIGDTAENYMDKTTPPGGTATITLNAMINQIESTIYDEFSMGL
jgi:hypothetical protein